MKVAIALTLSLLTFNCLAQETPAADLRLSYLKGCVSRGLQRGDDPNYVNRFCNCSFDVLANGLTVAEYIELERASQQRIAPSNIQAVAALQPKLSECKR